MCVSDRGARCLTKHTQKNAERDQFLRAEHRPRNDDVDDAQLCTRSCLRFYVNVAIHTHTHTHREVYNEIEKKCAVLQLRTAQARALDVW